MRSLKYIYVDAQLRLDEYIEASENVTYTDRDRKLMTMRSGTCEGLHSCNLSPGIPTCDITGRLRFRQGSRVGMNGMVIRVLNTIQRIGACEEYYF